MSETFGEDTAHRGQQEQQQQQEFLNKNGFRDTPEPVPECPVGSSSLAGLRGGAAAQGDTRLLLGAPKDPGFA